MPKIDFLYFNAGGGHRAAATALQSVVASQNRPWRVRLVNLNDILLPTDILKKTLGLGLEDIYNLLLRKGWTLGSKQLVPVMHLLIRAFHRRQIELISEFWRRDTPDLVVSLIPNFNRAVFEALRRVTPQSPYVTILTDIADYPPHFWIERQPQYLVCGSAKAVEQARAMGHPDHAIFRTSGMILRPTFYNVPPIDVPAGRAAAGLQADLPTGLVLFGGHGSPQMLDIARRLDGCGRRLQLIMLCGHNEKLAARLRELKLSIPLHVESFTSEVPLFMQMADFFIGKPGPGSISEALAMGLPVVVESNAWTLPQERYNAEWIAENKLGIQLKSFRQIAAAVTRLLDGEMAEFRQKAAALHNQAVFEIPPILETVLDRGPLG
ncbi:MAG: galactosyldiacylglycerol synthase [Acidimicrobiia bacterium]|nr:galactosyldiacylglycerol synthase [Acidimicrobiia bacterium]